ncbi:MAG: TfoX/Sxy family protein [Clostridia bacterium]
MASTEEYVQYVCEQMSGAGTITYKKMFGEYTIYCDQKVLGLICDNQVFIKPTAAADAMMPTAARMPPYEGAKPKILIEDIEDRDFLCKLIQQTCSELPLPKPKKKKEK